MDYDSKQTGGYGFVIEFPDSVDHPPVERYYRADDQGIHRLEMLAVLTGLNELIDFQKSNAAILRNVSGVRVHTDRLSISDGEINNPYRIQEYRKRKWKTYDGNPVKHHDLLDAIDKARKKLTKVMSGRIEIVYTREKKNKAADKLSRQGKRSSITSKAEHKRGKPKAGRRKLSGEEVDYASLSEGDELDIHVFYKDPVQQKYEVRAEIMEGEHNGRTIRTYLSAEQESQVHRHHIYRVVVREISKHHVKINIGEEV